MKKTLLLIVLTLCCRLLTFAQATSLTVDCQTPGWLSSYINPSDITTVRNLKVTGVINENDLKTIGNLVKNYNLKGRLDLSEVQIQENVLDGEMFGVNDCELEYFATPINIAKLHLCIDWVSVDTLEAGSSSQPSFKNTDDDNKALYSRSGYSLKLKHLILREGSIYININGLDRSNWPNTTLQSIQLPQSMKTIGDITYCKNLTKLNVPNNVEKLGSLYGTKCYINSDTLVVPSSVRVFYSQWATPDGYKGSLGNDGTNHPGHISCIYFPANLDTIWAGNDSPGNLTIDSRVTIHFKSRIPPRFIAFCLKNCILYVPNGCKDAYSSWNKNGNIIIEENNVESVALEKHTLSLNVGDSEQLIANVSPATASNKKLIWSSSNAEVATVDGDGVVTALKAGNAYIKATSEDNPEAADSCKVIVNQPVTGITLDKTTLELFGIGTSTQLVATIEPADAVNQQVKWASSNESVCIVANGNVVAVGYGTSIVIATTVDGSYMATCKVTVAHPFEITTQSVAVPVNTLRNIPINVNNHADVKSFKFTVNVPQKVKFNSDALPAQRCSDFDVTTTYNADSTIVWVEGTMTEQALAIGEGAFVLLPIKSSEYIDNYDIWLNNITFVGADEMIGTETLPDAILTLRVLNFGDVNNDKKVDISDVNAVINRMLGKSNGGTFIFELADMDENGIIDISDVNAIINLMLGK